jgi:hypothetical protein
MPHIPVIASPITEQAKAQTAFDALDPNDANVEETEILGFGSASCTPDTIVISPGSPSLSGTTFPGLHLDTTGPQSISGAFLSADANPDCVRARTTKEGPGPNVSSRSEAMTTLSIKGAAYRNDGHSSQPRTMSSPLSQEASLRGLMGSQQALISATSSCAATDMQSVLPALSRMPLTSSDSPLSALESPAASSMPQNRHLPRTGDNLPETPSTAAVDTPTLETEGREDILPTPHFSGSHNRGTALKSPSTPQDLPFKPFAFSLSAGSHFATPEVPISTCMTPMTASEARQAQKHIPAWNRVSRVVEKQAPLTFRQVRNLWATPTGQQPCAKTPFLLLQSVCSFKGWELTVRHEAEVRIGSATSVVATVNVPDVSGGRAFSAVGKSAGAPTASITCIQSDPGTACLHSTGLSEVLCTAW